MAIDDQPEWTALHIRAMTSGQLVTIIELVSPRNKQMPDILTYRTRRARLVYEQRIQMVEIDLTRSVQRLMKADLNSRYAYHAAIHLPDELPHFVGVKLAEPFKRIAIPLRQSIVPTDIHSAYQAAYIRNATAGHILNEGRYTEADLPFPTLLTDDERHAALAAVERWQNDLRGIMGPG